MNEKPKKQRDYQIDEAELLECIALDASSILKAAGRAKHLKVVNGPTQAAVRVKK